MDEILDFEEEEPGSTSASAAASASASGWKGATGKDESAQEEEELTDLFYGDFEDIHPITEQQESYQELQQEVQELRQTVATLTSNVNRLQEEVRDIVIHFDWFSVANNGCLPLPTERQTG